LSDISVEELARRRGVDADLTIVDIREPWEIEICSLPEAQTISLRTIAADPSLIPRDREVVLVCHAGGRSDQLATFLIARGYDRVRSLRGGLDQWAIDIDPSMTRY
jgi:rhodanese-related sulfurtransferase